MNSYLHDLRGAVRSVADRPGFALVAVLTLALGIGANIAIFSILNGLLLRPLPYPDQERLMYLNETAPSRGREVLAVSLPDFTDWRDRSEVFEAMAAYRPRNIILTGSGEPQRLEGTRVTAELFSVLGVDPVMGRVFRPEENRPGGDPVVMLSYTLWQQQLGGDPAVIGRPVTIDGESRVVVGVMPPGFSFPRSSLLWVPLGLDPALERHDNHMYQVVARLKPGVSLERARANLSVVARQIGEEHPEMNGDVEATLVPLREHLVGQAGLAFLIFMGAVGFVLLIACANVANLLLVRASTREREMAIRSALGASRWRIIRMLLAESIVLALGGGALGLLVGRWGRDLWMALAPLQVPLWMRFDFDPTVLGFVVAVTALTVLAFGAVPALLVSRPNLQEGLKDGGIRSAGGSAGRLRGVFVVAEVALTSVLLIGAGLMMRSLLHVLEADPGFRTDNIITMAVELPTAKYSDLDQLRVFFGRLVPAIRVLPGVQHAAAISYLPLGGRDWGQSFTVEGEPEAAPGRSPIVNNRVATPGYFETMGIGLIAGRVFDDRDGMPDTPPVVIVNQALAGRHWPGTDPIGKRLKFGPAHSDEPWMTVIGVVGNVRHYGLDQEVRDGLYLPYRLWPMSRMILVVRSATDPTALIEPVRQQVWAMDRDLPVFDIRTLQEIADLSLWQRRLDAWLLGGFAVVALLLAALGIYGVISYAVAQRTREIGIRLAIGARAGQVRGEVIRHGMALALVGTVLGLAAAGSLTRVLAAQLYSVSALDPVTFVMVPVLLLGVALLACALPARRATRIDPLVALRCE